MTDERFEEIIKDKTKCEFCVDEDKDTCFCCEKVTSISAVELKEFWQKIKTINDFSNSQLAKILAKLQAYQQAEADGLLVRLPCKNWLEIVFGNQCIFYGVDTDCAENPIHEISVDNAERFTWYGDWRTLTIKGTIEDGCDYEFTPEEVGKTVFLTREEAEQALKELEGQT